MAHRNPRNFHIPAPRASRDSSRYYGIELDRTLLASAPPNLFRTGAQRLFVSGHRVQGSPLPPTAQVMDSFLSCYACEAGIHTETVVPSCTLLSILSAP